MEKPLEMPVPMDDIFVPSIFSSDIFSLLPLLCGDLTPKTSTHENKTFSILTAFFMLFSVYSQTTNPLLSSVINKNEKSK